MRNVNESNTHTPSNNGIPVARAEHRRKRKGVRGSWHYLIRQCCYCGASHSHNAAGVQMSHCVPNPRPYSVVVIEPARAEPGHHQSKE
jgi:hypothetical protein